MHRSNHIKHYRKQLYFLRLTKRDVTSAQCIFNWNRPSPAQTAAKLNFKLNIKYKVVQI